MNFEPEKLGDVIRALLRQAGINPPAWLTHLIAWLALVSLAICAIWGILFVLAQIRELAAGFVPYRLSQEVRRKLMRRRRFVEHIENEIRKLNTEQSWSDYRFAELEAEVEAEGRRWALPLLPLIIPRTTSGLRRESSLTKALDTSRERLILVEGDPGSGKSVALRHVATQLAQRAKSGGLSAVIPLYINLKELEESENFSVDRNLIEAFVLNSLNRANDRDVEDFLEQEFRPGLDQGTWLFLFDSFDEIPEILGSIEPDAVIRKYTNAIQDFLHGMNRCRGVVASRYFRGPGQVSWPRFRILPLSMERREELVRKADLPVSVERELLGLLPWAAERIGDQAQNPLFLGLICEHMKSGKPFPENGHALFESYINQRLLRDEDRIDRRFKVNSATVRKIAEKVAFCMAADAGLGLSPSRERIATSMARLGLEAWSVLPTCLDALEFIKLARSEGGSGGAERMFTFAHRRFQEYFATCLVQASPGRVVPQDLLLDGRWRETAIVICQTAPPKTLEPLLLEARNFLAAVIIPNTSPDKDPTVGVGENFRDFPWPPGVLHTLGLLQDGFAGRLEALPEDLRLRIGEILTAAYNSGTLADRKWSLEVAGASDQPTLITLMKRAFFNPSRWLAEVGYRQVGRLRRIPPEIAFGIRSALMFLFLRGHLRRERHATFAHLSRLDGSEPFLLSLRVLLSLPLIELTLQILALLSFLVSGSALLQWPQRIATLACLILISWWVLNIILPALVKFEVLSTRSIHALASRAMLVVLFILAFSSNFSYSEFFTVGIFVYSLAWSFFVLLAIELGLEFRLSSLPLIPFLVLYDGLKSVLSLDFSWRDLVRSLRDTLAMVSIPLLAFLISKWFGKTLLLNAVIWLIIVTLGLGFSLAIILKIFTYARDWRLLRRTLASPVGLTVAQFLEAVTSFGINRFRIQYIRAVRQRSLLPVSTGTESVIVDLAIKVELRFRRRNRGGTALQSFTKDINWNSAAVDELYRLREALRVVPIATAPSLGREAAPRVRPSLGREES